MYYGEFENREYEKVCCDVSVRPPVHSLRGREGNQVSARREKGYVTFSWREMCNTRFSWREITQETTWALSSLSKTCLL